MSDKELFNEKIRGVYAQLEANATINNQHFQNITEILNRIEEQTKKTNGRVNKLEEKVNNLEIADIQHHVNCPQKKKITELLEKVQQLELNDSNEKAVKNYKKALWAAVVSILSMIIGFLLKILNIG